MEHGVRIVVVWFDEHVLQLRVEASNGRFAATTELYEGLGALTELADSLERFPRTIDDCRQVTLGTVDPRLAGGGIRLSFACSDRAGHATVRVQAQSPVHDRIREPETAEFDIALEAAAIDEFVAALRAPPTVRASHALLRQAIWPVLVLRGGRAPWTCRRAFDVRVTFTETHGAESQSKYSEMTIDSN